MRGALQSECRRLNGTVGEKLVVASGNFLMLNDEIESVWALRDPVNKDLVFLQPGTECRIVLYTEACLNVRDIIRVFGAAAYDLVIKAATYRGRTCDRPKEGANCELFCFEAKVGNFSMVLMPWEIGGVMLEVTKIPTNVRR